MKKRTKGFLRDELISHKSEQFDYIVELNNYLWEFVRCELPAASGKLSDYLDVALENAKYRAGKMTHNTHCDTSVPVNDSTSVDISDSDIATIEALHDLLLDVHGYSLDFVTLKRARELTAKMYNALKKHYDERK